MKNNQNSDELSDISGVQIEDVTPKDLLKLGRQILLVLTILFTLGAIAAIIWPNSAVFEACRTILPPIATLVIGYYFGKS